MKTLLLALILAVPVVAVAELPEAPKPQPLAAPFQSTAKPKLDRTDWALLFAGAGSRALDTYSTRWMLRQGNHEIVLPGFIVNHTSTMATYSACVVVGNYLSARYLVRHRHQRLAKIVLGTDAVQDGFWAVHNLFLKAGKS